MSIASIRTDHGRESDNEVQFGEFCNANSITHNFSAPSTPQSNGMAQLIVRVFYLVDFSFDLLLTIIMENLPPPNNDPNIPEDEHAPAPEHAPIAPNPAPIQPNDYLANDEADPKEEPEEEEEPIPEQAPAAPVGFAPQWIGGHDPNNNGWIEEDIEDEVEAKEEDEEEMEDEEMEVEDNDGENDNAEVYNPYEEADPFNRPPPSPETAASPMNSF
ncbi:putative reverse transcriptase domain-containing protein [Tanacetum coccineum]